MLWFFIRKINNSKTHDVIHGTFHSSPKDLRYEFAFQNIAVFIFYFKESQPFLKTWTHIMTCCFSMDGKN